MRTRLPTLALLLAIIGVAAVVVAPRLLEPAPVVSPPPPPPPPRSLEGPLDLATHEGRPAPPRPAPDARVALLSCRDAESLLAEGVGTAFVWRGIAEQGVASEDDVDCLRALGAPEVAITRGLAVLHTLAGTE